ncbi:MAG: lytic transglycosylase domain-containing protein [Nitrospinae bacterium]|nr:lytic transglycosylase domain-containing protein [Nitrospinota bacterium]
MNLIIGALIATYLLFLIFELSNLRRGGNKYLWAFSRFLLAGIALTAVWMLHAQPLPPITKLIQLNKIPFLTPQIHLDQFLKTTTIRNSATEEPGIFWHIHHYSKLYEVDPLLVRAVIEVESNFNPQAVSNNGAKGLMQINPITAKHLGLNNVFDIGENIGGGVRYLRYLLELYGWNLHMALASYNAGPSNIQRYNGIPPFQETRRYVSRVIKVYKRLKRTDKVFNDTSRLSALLRPSPNTEANADRSTQRQISPQ